jgi:uncharacterized protein
MLLGMALFRWGFFSNRFTTGQYAALTVGGLAGALTLAWLSMSSFEQGTVDFTKLISSGMLPLADLLQSAERLFGAVGLASLVILLCRRGTGGRLANALGAVGKLALTNFLLQSLLCSLLFYGYGMSYFGSIRLPYLYVLIAEIWLLQLVCSMLWLRRFSIGPAEWLWKSLTDNRKQAIRVATPTPVLS